MTAEWSAHDGPTWHGGVLRAMQVGGLAAFCAGLAAVAVASCVLSYAGLHALAEQGGIQAHYAKGYPLLLDGLLVIALAAVLTLRGARLPSRVLSWLTLLVLLVVAAGAEALHATGRTLPREAAAITVAALPWLLVLVTFVLLLAILRHARPPGRAGTQREPPYPDARPRDPHRRPLPTASPLPVRTPLPRNSAPIVPDLSSRLVSGAAAGAAAAQESHGHGGGTSGSADPEPPDETSTAAGADPPTPSVG